jgi:hypothetical protein
MEKGERLKMKDNNTTYLIRNIPRKTWNKVKVKGIEKGMKLNDLMLNLVTKFSKGKIKIDE